MGLNNRTADGKSHAHAAGFRSEKGLKDPSYCVRVKTYPRAFYRYLHLVRFHSPGGDHQFARPLIDTAHRFHTTHDQVQPHLLQLHAIAGNRWKVIGKLRADDHLPFLRFVPDERKDLPNGVVQVQLLAGRGRPLGQRPNAGDHFPGALAVANDVADSLTDFLHVRCISGQETQASAAVAHDARQRLVDFMRDRGGQFSHHAHPVDVRKFFLELSQLLALLFGTFAVFNIGCHAASPHYLPALVTQAGEARLEPAILAVGAATQPHLILHRLAPGRQPLPLIDNHLEIVGMYCRLPAGSRRLLHRHPRIFDPAPIHEGTVAVGPGNKRQGRHGFNRFAELLFLRRELANAELISRPKQEQKNNRANTAEPPRAPPGGKDLDAKAYPFFVPDAAIVAALYAKEILTGRERGVRRESVVTVGFNPVFVQTHQFVPVAVPERAGITEARELQREDVLPVRERQGIREQNRFSEWGVTANRYWFAKQAEFCQNDRRDIWVVGHPFRKERRHAVDSAEEHLPARALVVDAEIVELVARQPIVGVVVLEGPGPRVEFGQAVPGAQPQVARGVFEDALYGVVRQTVALVENCKLAGLGVIPIQSVLGADPELARSVHAQGVHAIVAKGSLDGGIVPVTDNLARPLVQALQAPLVGAEPDRSVRPFRNDSIDPAGRWACISIDGEMRRAGVEPVEAILCARPQGTGSIDEQCQDAVIAQAAGILGLVPVGLEAPGSAVESVQSASPGAEPENPRVVFGDGVDSSVGDAAGIVGPRSEERVLASLPVQPVQLIRAEPENSLAVLKDRESEALIQTVRVTGFLPKDRKGRRLAGKPVHPTAIRSHPDAALAILH